MSDLHQLAVELANPSGWRVHAACADMDTEVFFPERGSEVAYPLAVCRTCPVAGDCLAERLSEKRGRTYDDGVFGGTTPRQREQMRLGHLPAVPNLRHGGTLERKIELRMNPEPVQQPGVRQPQSDPDGFREHMRGLRSPRPEVGELDNCGTEQGYQRHRTLGETPCHVCTSAHRDHCYERGVA